MPPLDQGVAALSGRLSYAGAVYRLPHIYREARKAFRSVSFRFAVTRTISLLAATPFLPLPTPCRSPSIFSLFSLLSARPVRLGSGYLSGLQLHRAFSHSAIPSSLRPPPAAPVCISLSHRETTLYPTAFLILVFSAPLCSGFHSLAA